jgi:hypothetical protein
LEANPWNRQTFDTEAMKELVESIKARVIALAGPGDAGQRSSLAKINK